jgi:hypothetical protein
MEQTLPQGVTIETARDGAPTASIQTPTGPRQLHSRHQPLAEARRLVEKLDVSATTAVFVYGLGLGHHIRALFERLGGTINVFVFEPAPAVVRAAIEHVDLSDLFDSGRLRIIVDMDRGRLVELFTPMSATISAGLLELDHAPSVAAWPEHFEQVRQTAQDLKSYCGTAINTLLHNGRRTVENLLANLPRYVTEPSVQRLAGVGSGKPAIVVAAGPSLRKNIHKLRALRDRAYIIAVQTTLKPLLDHGIEPDFVTALDYHDISRRFYENLPPGVKTELVAEPKVAGVVLGLHPGPLSLLGSDFVDNLLHESRLSKTKLRAGATVAHLAFYLAEHLGCDPVIFVGQDLGFADGLCYTPGTSYEDVWTNELSRFCTVEMKQWEQIARDRALLRRIPDVHGRPMYTEQRLFAYLQQFERDFASSRSRVIDATEGGALKRGAMLMTLDEAAAKFCPAPIDRAIPPHPGRRSDVPPGVLDAIERRVDETRRIAAIADQTRPLLQEIADHIADQPRVNRCIAAIDPLRRQINDLGRTYDLLLQITQQSEMNRMKADMRIDAERLDGNERQRRQTLRDIENVDAVRRAADDFERMLNNALAQLRSMTPALKEAA